MQQQSNKNSGANMFDAYVVPLQRPSRQLLARLKRRQFVIVDIQGDIVLQLSVYQFRADLAQHPARISEAMNAKNIALAGWFSETEITAQLKFLRRALRERPDNALERLCMFPATFARERQRGRGYHRRADFYPCVA
jgi:hypothetical protein